MAVSDDMGRSKGTFTMVCVVVNLGGENTRVGFDRSFGENG